MGDITGGVTPPGGGGGGGVTGVTAGAGLTGGGTGAVTLAVGPTTALPIGDQLQVSQDTSPFREGSWSLTSSGQLFTLVGDLVMKYWSHNTAIDGSGNFALRGDAGPCAIITFSEGIGTNAPIYAMYSCPTGIAGSAPGTFSLVYSIDMTTGVITNPVTLAANTSGDGVILKTPVAAAAANQQYSPRLHFTGQGWATTPVASQPVDWIIEVQPIQGAANPSSNLVLSSATNGGAFSTALTITSGGGAANVATFNGGLASPNMRVTGATLPIAGIYSAGSNSLNFAASSATAGSFDTNKNFIHLFAIADQSKSVQVPTTGFTITVGNNTSTLIINPAGTLATGTVTMPATPIDGQEVRFSSTQVVTTLTVSPNTSQTISNAPTTIAAGQGYAWIYHLAATNWFRLY